MAEIKSLSHTHVAILDYLMANPKVRLREVAEHFGYTQPWLSQIIHSDAFQAMLAERQDIAFHDTVLPVRQKMTNLAHMALDKMADMLPTEADVRTVRDVAEGMLDRLGYGAKPVGGVNVNINQQNNLVVPNSNAAEIARAREMLLAQQPALGVQINGVSTPIALPRASAAEMGETVLEGDFSSADRAHSETEGGTAV